MLSKEQIESNKTKFITILRENVTRDGADVEALINKLENSDWFTAPASTKYYGSYEGGLCESCLQVYNKLAEITMNDSKISKESVVITAFFNSFYKMNFYTSDTRNVKVYSSYGTKSDNKGKFNWEAQEYYRVKDAEERFIYGTNGETSEFMLRFFIPLTVDESKAIVNATRSFEDGLSFMTDVFASSSLVVYLHCAYMMCTYIDQSQNNSIY